MTTSAITFPCFTDSFPWLTSEPLVALHPSLTKHIKKPRIQQIDPVGDFAVIWPPIREALTIESLRGAAVTFTNLAGRVRLADGVHAMCSAEEEGDAR